MSGPIPPAGPVPPGVTLPTDAIVAFGVVVVVLVLGTLAAVRKFAFYGNFGTSSDRPPESKTNCPECGARVPSDRETCDYCGDPIAEGTREADG